MKMKFGPGEGREEPKKKTGTTQLDKFKEWLDKKGARKQASKSRKINRKRK